MNIKPSPTYILIEPVKQEEERASGLVVPESTMDKPSRGTVLEVGEETDEEKCPCRKGQKVIFRRYAGQEIRDEDRELKLVKFEDIMATYG